MERHRSQISYGNGGWVRYRSSRSALAAYVRYIDRDGRLEPAELYLEQVDAGVLDSNSLREIPLGEINAWVNAEPALVRDRLGIAAPDLRRAARHYSTTTWGHPDKVLHWVAAMYWAQIPGSGIPQAPLPKVKPFAPVEVEPVDPALNVPPARPYGDDFYAQVADVYRALSLIERSPAGAIADANGVPITTAHRWVKVARQRGLLEPARRQKRG